MKKRTIIAALMWTAFAVLVAADFVHQFAVNDPVGYFATEPRQLLYVAAIAITGGLAALGFYRLSPRARRHIRIFGWGAAASTVTGFIVWFAFSLVSLASLAAQYGGVLWVLVALLSFGGLAAYLWFEFIRALKAGGSQ